MSFDAATSPAPTVLLVEDDADLRSEMARYLSSNGYVVHEAGDTGQARRLIDAHQVQVVVLDVNLPGEDGLSLCRALADNGGPPILMLSALGESVDRILGLELGADDYVVKPITPRELLARVKAMLRRRGVAPAAAQPKVYNFGGFRLDLAARQLRAPSGTVLLLTPGELAILTALLDKPQSVVPREELMRGLRGDSAEALGRSVDLHISRLRRKIQDQTDQEVISTYRGVGYTVNVRVVAE